MSIMIDLPPVVERDIRYCANARGISFAQLVFELVEREAARIRSERSSRVKPNVSDFIGYGLRFDDKPTTTAEYMAEMREGEMAPSNSARSLFAFAAGRKGALEFGRFFEAFSRAPKLLASQ